MKYAGLLLLLSATGVAGAQPVYKCTRADGSNSYQSTPCATDEISATRAHRATVSGQAPVSAPASAGTLGTPAVPGQRRAQVRHPAADAACDGARAQRTAALGAAGASATAEMRQGLDRAVQDACG
ncbi:DUF4124 domain-containing protein [Pseudoxanthomonas sp. 10H]|uniref:DUF4124 domain-containing protein n=1 Tax=Pseudoxanthomonas sp. 10H TaxID=3242729 RepID=UPI0035592D12